MLKDEGNATGFKKVVRHAARVSLPAAHRGQCRRSANRASKLTADRAPVRSAVGILSASMLTRLC